MRRMQWLLESLTNAQHSLATSATAPGNPNTALSTGPSTAIFEVVGLRASDQLTDTYKNSRARCYQASLKLLISQN
jgi:hypothetical protein